MSINSDDIDISLWYGNISDFIKHTTDTHYYNNDYDYYGIDEDVHYWKLKSILNLFLLPYFDDYCFIYFIFILYPQLPLIICIPIYMVIIYIYKVTI